MENIINGPRMRLAAVISQSINYTSQMRVSVIVNELFDILTTVIVEILTEIIIATTFFIQSIAVIIAFTAASYILYQNLVYIIAMTISELTLYILNYVYSSDQSHLLYVKISSYTISLNLCNMISVYFLYPTSNALSNIISNNSIWSIYRSTAIIGVILQISMELAHMILKTTESDNNNGIRLNYITIECVGIMLLTIHIIITLCQDNTYLTWLLLKCSIDAVFYALKTLYTYTSVDNSISMVYPSTLTSETDSNNNNNSGGIGFIRNVYYAIRSYGHRIVGYVYAMSPMLLDMGRQFLWAMLSLGLLIQFYTSSKHSKHNDVGYVSCLLWLTIFSQYIIGLIRSMYSLIIHILLQYKVSSVFKVLSISELNRIPSDEVCPICLLGHNKNTRRLPCGHLIHIQCLTQMMHSNQLHSMGRQNRQPVAFVYRTSTSNGSTSNGSTSNGSTIQPNHHRTTVYVDRTQTTGDTYGEAYGHAYGGAYGGALSGLNGSGYRGPSMGFFESVHGLSRNQYRCPVCRQEFFDTSNSSSSGLSSSNNSATAPATASATATAAASRIYATATNTNTMSSGNTAISGMRPIISRREDLGNILYRLEPILSGASNGSGNSNIRSNIRSNISGSGNHIHHSGNLSGTSHIIRVIVHDYTSTNNHAAATSTAASTSTSSTTNINTSTNTNQSANNTVAMESTNTNSHIRSRSSTSVTSTNRTKRNSSTTMMDMETNNNSRENLVNKKRKNSTNVSDISDLSSTMSNNNSNNTTTSTSNSSNSSSSSSSSSIERIETQQRKRSRENCGTDTGNIHGNVHGNDHINGNNNSQRNVRRKQSESS